MYLRVALAQINPTVGDLAHNRNKILFWTQKAQSLQTDILVFPQMATTGYPLEDLALNPDFIEASHRVLNEIVEESKGLT
ncbi:MAG: nitrilase-related carbon-nitrogen hydrolase, partial [Desulfatiglandales bacterium]